MLHSLSNQQIFDYKIEILFVLDDCTDNTKSIIQEWIKNNSQFHSTIIPTIIHSCGGARNKGLDQAKGTYIWFLDGDDWLIGDKAIFTALDFITFTNAPYIRFNYNHPEEFQHLHGYFSMVWQYLFKRETIGDLRFQLIQPEEDNRFMEAIIQQYGDTPPYMNESLYYYNYLREGSNMQQLLTTGRIVP